MPRTQTTSVEVVIRARAVAARTELAGLRKDTTEFFRFTREQFRSLGGAKVAAPKLGNDWRALEREIGTIAKQIQGHINSISNLKLRAPAVGTFLRNANTNAAAAASSGVTTSGAVSRASEIEDAARLTREWRAGALAADDYRQKLQEVARTSASGSERELDALTRIRAAEKAATAETTRRAVETKRAADETARLAAQAAKPPARVSEIEDAARLTREYRATTLSAEQYRAKLQEIARTASAGSERQIDALQRIQTAERNAAQAAETAAGRLRARQARRSEGLQLGSNLLQRGGDALTVAVTAPIVAGFTAGAKAAIDYEAALRNVNSIAQLSEKEFQGLYKSVINLTNDPGIKQGPTELAKALYELQSSGFSVTKALDDPKNAITALAVSAKGATAGLSDTATSSNALIAVLNSGIGGVSSAQQAMDTLFQTVNDGKLNFNELASSIGAVLPTAAKAGITLQELGGAIALQTIQGQSGSEAINDLLNLITKIANPGEVAERQFRKLGISFGFSGLQANGLTGVLQQINKATGGNADAIKRLLPDMQAQRAALSLLKNDVKDYNGFVEAQSKANDGVGATQRALAEQTKSFQFQLDKLKQEFLRMATEAGPGFIRALSGVVAVLRPLIDLLSRAADNFAKMSPEEQETTLKLLAMVAAVGPLISGLGRLAGTTTDVIRLFQLLKPVAASVGTTLAAETATGVAEVGIEAAKTTAQVGGLRGALALLGKVGTIGLTITLAVVGAEVLTRVINQIDKYFGGGLAAKFAEYAEFYGADKETVDRIRKNGIPTLSDAVGMGGKYLEEAGKARSNAQEAANNPLAVAQGKVNEARTRRQQDYDRAKVFGNIANRTGGVGFSNSEIVAIRDEYNRRGMQLPTGVGPGSGVDWFTAAKNLAQMNARDAATEGQNIQGVRRQQDGVRGTMRREAGAKAFGGSIGNFVPAPGVNLGGLDNRTRNVLRATTGAGGTAGRIVSVSRDKNGRQVIVLEGNTDEDATRIQEGATGYGFARVRAGETAKSVADSISATREGNRITISVQPPVGQGAGVRRSGGVVQPPPRDRRGGARGGRVIEAKTDAIAAEATVQELEARYNLAFEQYGERGDKMSATDRGQAQQGLLALANKIQAAQEKVAAEKLQEANDAAGQRRANADKIRKEGQTQVEIDRANEAEAEANKGEAEASAKNAGVMAEIRRTHSDRYRAILKTQEKIQQSVAEQDARDAEQNHTIEAQKHERRIAEIDAQLQNEQDATKREALLSERFDEANRAATEKYLAAFSGTAGIVNPRDKARAQRQAGSEYTDAQAAIKRERDAAGLQNDKLRLENEIKLHEMQAANIDDLIAKNEALKKVEDERLGLMQKEGAPAFLIEAGRQANDRAQKERQADIARDNIGRLLVKASTEGIDSFATPGYEGLLSKREAGSDQFRTQLRGLFQSQYENTPEIGRGRVAEEQFSTLQKAVEVNMVALNDVLPLLRDIELRINGTGDFDASQQFYKGLKKFFDEQLKDTYTINDRLKGPKRDAAYNDLIAGIQGGRQFSGLSERERETVIKSIQERRDSKDDSDKTSYHEGLSKIGDEAVKEFKKSADKASGDVIGALFGDKQKAQKASREFWLEVADTGRKSLARVGNELLLKPLAGRLQNGLEAAFHRGADRLTASLDKSLQSFGDVFKGGVAGILQAAVYLNGVLALAGKSGGRRGKKGGTLGLIAGVGIAAATGGTGLALLGAGLTGASAGSQVAQGNYLQAAAGIGTAFLPGGSLASMGGAGGGVGSAAVSGLALGGPALAGHLYKVNEKRSYQGPEYFAPNVDGMVIPSATAISRLPSVAKANNDLLERLNTLASGGGMGSNGDLTLNDYGDKYYESDSRAMIRNFAREVRDTMNRRA